MARRKPDANAGWNWDHRDLRPSLRARSAAANVASSIAPVTRIRAPLAKTISILRGSGGTANSGAADCGFAAMDAGTNLRPS
jgi:hypothetical protein